MSSTAKGSPERPLKRAVIGWLRTGADLMALVTTVIDTPPRDAKTAYPYLVMGAPRLTRDGAMQSLHWGFTFELHTWSEANGQREAQAIHDALMARLDRARLAVDGYRLIDLACEFADVFRDEDAENPAVSRYHGVTRWRGQLEQVA